MITCNNLIADEKYKPGYYEVEGDYTIYQDYKKQANSCFDPYKYPSLLNDMTVEGVKPSAIVVQREPSTSYFNGVGYHYYNYYYYAFYGEFTENKFVVSYDRDGYRGVSNSFNEYVYNKSNKFDVSINDYNGTIRKYYLAGYQIESNLYKQKRLDLIEENINQFNVDKSEAFKYQHGGFSCDYIIFTQNSEDKIFRYPDDSNFRKGVLQSPGLQKLESKELQVIPEMANLAVVFLVFCLISYWVLKISLRILRIFLPI